MIKDKMARIKLKKHFHEQRPYVYVGKIAQFTETWVAVHGKGVMVSRSQPNGVQIDQKASLTLIPRDNIESIRVLPDTYDLNAIRITTDGQQLRLVVEGGLDVFIAEMGEG
jgi:hypothetical protein